MCSQFFVASNFNKWDVHPLKHEAQNLTALQDHCGYEGIPDIVPSDNAASKTREKCIEGQTTVPDGAHMNPAEQNIGHLRAMVRTCQKEFEIAYKRSQLVQKWCCKVHNVASRPSTTATFQTYLLFAFTYANRFGTLIGRQICPAADGGKANGWVLLKPLATK